MVCKMIKDMIRIVRQIVRALSDAFEKYFVDGNADDYKKMGNTFKMRKY